MPFTIHPVRTGTSGTFVSDYIGDIPSGTGGSSSQWVGAVRYMIRGKNLTQTGISSEAIHGVYNITGTNAGTMPKAAIIGEVHADTTTADACFMAVIGGGDVTATSVTSFYSIDVESNFGTVTYGLDLKGTGLAPTYANASIRLGNGNWLVALTTPITANTTTTTAPAGSWGMTSNATGNTKLFVSDGSKWQFGAVS